MDPNAPGMLDLHVTCVHLLFSFKFDGKTYPCALVDWFKPVSKDPAELTSMWVIQPEFHADRVRERSVVHLDTIVWVAHPIGVYGVDPLPAALQFTKSLDALESYYVNKYIDHHCHEIAF